MKERPILFSGPMVRAILEGGKTVTRRVIRPQPYVDYHGNACWNGRCLGQSPEGIPHLQSIPSPYGDPGDRLWVRETFYSPYPDVEYYSCLYTRTVYRADHQCDHDGPWKPSIHMPRAISRITLEVVHCRVERLKEITEEDAMREGIRRNAYGGCGSSIGPVLYSHEEHPTVLLQDTARDAFRVLWEGINGKRPGCSWKNDPFVWRVEFRRLET